MIALLQRVSHAEVVIAGEQVAAIGRGLLVLIGVERHDTELEGERLLERLLDYRVFPDAQGRMNLSVRDVNGGLLLVPQFTLAADTQKGTRPSFSPAAVPEEGRRLFEEFVARARASHAPLGTGSFGADMQLTLTNDGPVTFWLRVRPAAHAAR
jgi:D-tyrosyl-tRNA(Tyr) deacylase